MSGPFPVKELEYMDKEAELRQWIELADNDLSIADFSAKNMWPVPFEIICFHCQQAVEKYLKWFLVLHDMPPPKSHDLEELEKLCETIVPAFSEIYEKCTVLSGFAVQSRYPYEIRVEKQDMDKALSYAKYIREFIRNQYPLKIDDKFKDLE